MKRSKILIYTITAALIFSFVSCNDEFLNIQNPNDYSEDSYFTTAEQLQEAVAAAYYGFYHNGLFAREWYFYHDLLGNDAKAAPAIVGTGAMGQLPAFNYDGTNSEIQNSWRSLYRIVLRATIALDKANEFEATTQQEQTIKQRVTGESSFLKAWAYFSLYRLWGVVPLRKSIADMAIKDFPRAESEQEVVDYIVELLTTAQENLPVEWDEANLGRATRGAAVAVLGKLYMWEGNCDAAETEFAKLAQAPYNYELVSDYGMLHNEAGDNNAESIFEIQHAFNEAANIWYMFGGQESWGPNQATTGRAMEFGFNDWFNTFVSNSAVQAFTYTINGEEYTDPRAFYTFYGDEASGGDTDFYCEDCEGNTQPYPFDSKGYAWKKYQRYEIMENEGVPKSPINTRIIRYADVLLMRAECMIEKNNTSGALELINQVRERAGAKPYQSLGSNPMEILKRERRLELTGEQVRFFDLIRWGDLVETLNPEKQAQGEGTPVQEKHYHFPITIDELDINLEMKNNVYNPGWN
ncbi:MAG TPA: RagB/SusD family nutrient uptake outer membrane protein [Prolixibacteraceae bacterium]|nr:RagB/SusD family nutrient uptake outer membrane protein [Prolixibacteraceae bacterium]